MRSVKHPKVKQCAMCKQYRRKVYMVKVGRIVPCWMCREHFIRHNREAAGDA